MACGLGSPDNVFGEFGDVPALYFGGDMEAAVPLCGQVAGRIEEIMPVAEILARIDRECRETLRELARYNPLPATEDRA